MSDGIANNHPQPQSREPYAYPAAPAEPPKFYNSAYTSPVNANFPPQSPISHAHPQRPSSISQSQSPRMASMASPVARQNGAGVGGPVVKQEPAAPAAVCALPIQSANNASNVHNHQTPSRPADPMAFSSILSNAEPAPQLTPTPAVAKPRKPSRE
jgi:DNA helicase INO80